VAFSLYVTRFIAIILWTIYHRAFIFHMLIGHGEVMTPTDFVFTRSRSQQSLETIKRLSLNRSIYIACWLMLVRVRLLLVLCWLGQRSRLQLRVTFVMSYVKQFPLILKSTDTTLLTFSSQVVSQNPFLLGKSYNTCWALLNAINPPYELEF